MTKATSERGCYRRSVVETKGIIEGRIFGRDTTLMSGRQLNITEVATSKRCRDVDPSAKPNEVLAKKLKLQPFINQGPQTMSRPLIQVAI